jgi:hypothetical protein
MTSVIPNMKHIECDDTQQQNLLPNVEVPVKIYELS